MPAKIFRVIFTFILMALAQWTVDAQNAPAGRVAGWIRVQSDNGEFSVEVPAEYGFFADKDGFSIGGSSGEYLLREMNMLNAFQEKTLVSFESYRAPKSALDVMREIDKQSGDGKTSEIKTAEYKIKQVVFETADSYTVKRYLSSKNHIYVMTAAARGGETPAMKRYLDSLVFKPGAKAPAPALDAVSFAALKATPIEIETKPAPATTPVDSRPGLPPADPNEKIAKLVIISKPRVSYTEAARQKYEQGVVAMRIAFAKEGRISKIVILRSLREGLLRQSVFAALRIKFLPQEINNGPVTVTKLVEYSFSIY
jgi:hypothetical protein